jgi:predicted component of type VI protein secretion system
LAPSSDSSKKPLGIMRPLGGGDPVPLLKDVLLIGRRPKCDIQLDFENVSGKHCELRLIHGVWHVRDVGSTNGTTVNGQKIQHDHGLMPDDELGIATHYFSIDYDPVAPSSLLDANAVLEEETGKLKSLMELAGLEGDTERRRRPRPERDRDRDESRSAARPPAAKPAEPPRPAAKAPIHGADDIDDPVPGDFLAAGALPSDDDFLSMIEEDLQQRKPKG